MLEHNNNGTEHESSSSSSFAMSDAFYAAIQSTWLIDSFYLFVNTPLSALALVCNVVSFVAMCRINRKENAIYSYLLLYTLTNSLGSLIVMLSFVAYAPRFFDFAMSPFARIMRCTVMSFVATTLYFFKNMLDVLLALERLSLFFLRVKAFCASCSPNTLAAAAFVLCTVINLPTYFLAQPKSDAAFFNITATTKYNYCGQPAFFFTPSGRLLTLLIIVVRDFATTLMEIVLGLLTIRRLHRYRLKHASPTLSDLKIYETERRLILMTGCLLAASVATHLVVSLSYVSFLLGLEIVFHGWMSLMTLLSVGVSNTLSCYFVYSYSRIFRESVWQTVALPKQWLVRLYESICPTKNSSSLHIINR